MNLLEIINNLDALDEESTIYAKAPWSPTSMAIVAREPDEGGVPKEAEQLGLDYFVEVNIAREFLEDWAQSAQSSITPEQKCGRIIRYAADDA